MKIANFIVAAILLQLPTQKRVKSGNEVWRDLVYSLSSAMIKGTVI